MGAARHRGRHRKARVARQPQAAVRDGGRHLERRVGRQPDRSPRGGTAAGAVRPGAIAAVALLGASVIVVTPVAPPPPPPIHVTSAEVRLAAASSVWNIPINLIQDIINIPYNEVQGINTLGESLLFSGTWLVASSSNVWGTDPGDPGHYYGLANLFPFPAFSNSLAAQISGLAAVLLPINSGCNHIACPNPSELVAGYFQPARSWSLLTTGKYTFDTTPVTGPDGTTHPPEGLWDFGGPVTWGAQYGHPEWNTKTDPVTGQPVVPWAGTTFTSNPLAPFSDYLTHLMSDPTSPENAIKFPTLTQIVTAVWNLVYGLFVAFSPIFPGSPYCLGLCGKTYGPGSVLAPPFYYDPAPAAPPPGFGLLDPGAGTASLNQGSAPVGANALAAGPKTTAAALGSTTPGSGSTTPGSGSTTPGSGSTTPGSGSTTPGSGSTTPGSGSTTPGSGSTTPGSGSTTPGSGSTTPGSGSTTPGSGSTTPGSGSTTPGSGTKTPGSGTKTSTGAHSGGGSAG